MELRHLRYFVAVATELHFGRAAAKLAIAQPPLSQQIQKLEKELGAQLFQRTKRRVQLTQAGKTFFIEAQAILARADEAVEKTRRADSGEAGQIAIGWVPWLDFTAVPPRVGKFCVQNPGAYLDVHNMEEPEQIAALRSGKIDVGFFLQPSDARQGLAADAGPVQSDIVLQHRMFAVVSKMHRLADSAQIPLAAFAAEPYILFRRESAPVLYDSVLRLYNRHGLTLRVRHEADSPSTVLGLVAAGLGVTIVPFSGSPVILGAVFRPIAPHPPMLDIALAWNAENESPLLAKFIDGVRRR